MNSNCTWKREIALIQDVKFDLIDHKKTLEHLQSQVIIAAQTQLDHLKTQHENYEQVAGLKKEIKNLQDFISKIPFKDEFKSNLTDLKELYSALYEEIARYKSKLPKPQLKHIEYTEDTELSSIKSTHSKRVLLSDTIKAAKTALMMADPKLDEPLDGYVSPIYYCLMTLSVLKIMLWNPLEWIFKGRVTSNTPIRYLMNNYIDNNKHMQAFQKFSTQILNCELITMTVASGFRELAPYATTLDLKKAIWENKKIPLNKNQPQIDPITLDYLFEFTFTSRLCNAIHLSKQLHNQDTSKLLSEYAFNEIEDHEHFKIYVRNPIL